MAAPEPRPAPGRPPTGTVGPGIQVHDEVEIRRDRDHVFEFVSDGERLPAWMEGVKRSRRVSPPGPIAAGTGYVLVGTLLGRRVESHYELTAYRPTETFSARMVSPFFSVEETYTFEASDGATTVTRTGRVTPLGRLRLLGPLLSVAMPRQVRTDLHNLRTILERRRGKAVASALVRDELDQAEANDEGRQGSVTR